jgi:hypothetical protein
LRYRDTDKAALYYGPLRAPIGPRSRWFALYGDTFRLVGIDEGVETYQVDQWKAVEGPDYVVCRLTVRFRDTNVVDFAVTAAAEGAACRHSLD